MASGWDAEFGACLKVMYRFIERKREVECPVVTLDIPDIGSLSVSPCSLLAICFSQSRGVSLSLRSLTGEKDL